MMRGNTETKIIDCVRSTALLIINYNTLALVVTVPELWPRERRSARLASIIAFLLSLNIALAIFRRPHALLGDSLAPGAFHPLVGERPRIASQKLFPRAEASIIRTLAQSDTANIQLSSDAAEYSNLMCIFLDCMRVIMHHAHV